MKKGIEKVISPITAMMAACSILLCSCSAATDTSEEPWSAPESTATTTTEETEEAIPLPTVNKKDSTSYEKIELDGVKEHSFTSTDYCYIESEKFVIFMDKDITIPGDFTDNIEAIIDEIERQLGISSMPESFEAYPVVNMSIYYENNYNPWNDWYVGDKIQIFLIVDRKPEGFISGADNMSAVFCEYELFSEDLWNSIPELSNDPWRRDDYIDYSTFAHELTHTVTRRNCDLSLIMTEGIAEYMGYSVVASLAADHPSIAECFEKKNWDEGTVPEKITAENAEAIFIDDYKSVDHADRGAEYYYGRRLWQFLCEEYGDDCFTRYCEKLTAENLTYEHSNYNEATMQKYAGYMKELFGDDVFTKFGDWCVENNYLQSLGM